MCFAETSLSHNKGEFFEDRYTGSGNGMCVAQRREMMDDVVLRGFYVLFRSVLGEDQSKHGYKALSHGWPSALFLRKIEFPLPRHLLFQLFPDIAFDLAVMMIPAGANRAYLGNDLIGLDLHQVLHESGIGASQ